MSNPTININLAKARLLNRLDDETRELFQLASKLNITQAEISFSGSGDSGDINDTSLYNDEKEVSPRGDYGPEGGWAENPNWSTDHQMLEDLSQKYFDNKIADRVDWDWYNNDGGGGTCRIYFDTGEVELSGWVLSQVDVDGTSFNLLGEEND